MREGISAAAVARVQARWESCFMVMAKALQPTSNDLASRAHVPVVATNNVHYHVQERHRLQNLLVAMRRNTTIDQVIPHIKPNSQ